jgi:hypothetical protein
MQTEIEMQQQKNGRASFPRFNLPFFFPTANSKL